MRTLKGHSFQIEAPATVRLLSILRRKGFEDNDSGFPVCHPQHVS